jgi:hypothetical protein
MGHGDINLTIGTYTHPQDNDKAGAVGKLPKIQVINKKQAKTGACTNSKPNEGVGARTQDLRLKRPLLYQLSYTLEKF